MIAGIVASSRRQAPAVEPDPYWNDVQSLLKFNNGFNDLKSNYWFPTPSNIEIVPDSTAFDGFCAEITGSTPSVLYSTQLSGKNWAAQDKFVIEFFIKPSSASTSYKSLFVIGGAGAPLTYSLVAGISNENKLYLNGAGGPLLTDKAVVLNEWKHVAVTKDGNLISLFYDGENLGSFVASSFPTKSPFRIGSSGLSTHNTYNGRIDEFRVTFGVVRYTANFTPPTEPFPAFGP